VPDHGAIVRLPPISIEKARDDAISTTAVPYK
jgi:hypothetical protein